METTQPIIISQPGGSTKYIVGGLLILAAAYEGNKWWEQHQKNSTDYLLDTPEGQIALQLKNVFSRTPVSDADYRKIMEQVTPANSDQVRKIYLKATTRNLQDDEAQHIGTGAAATVAKQSVINNTAGSLISIKDDRIIFNVGKGSMVRFPAGSTKPIPVYYTAAGVATGKQSNVLKPSARLYKVASVLEIPYESLKVRDDWKQLFTPYIRTRKVFAAVQLELLLPDLSKIYVWCDAREFRTYNKPTNGLGNVLNKLI